MLFQIYDIKNKYDRFCFTAESPEEAKEKLDRWLVAYNCSSLRHEFTLHQIKEPEIRSIVQDDWIPKKK